MMATHYRKSITPAWRAGIFCISIGMVISACAPPPEQDHAGSSASASSVSVSEASSVSSSPSTEPVMSSASSTASVTLSPVASTSGGSKSSSQSISNKSQSSVASSQSSHAIDVPAVPHENTAASSQSSSALAPAKTTPPAEAAANTASLDLDSLELRLRETKAIGVFTKLSLKNQVDDLLNDFRTFYRGKSRLVLSDLRQRYDLLVMKILTLLQDSDTRLAADIRSSREAIWDILQDPEKFSKIS